MVDEFVQAGIIDASRVPVLQEACEKGGRRVVFVDATFVLPGSEGNIYGNYIAERLPGAVFFDIEKTADQKTDLPHMLPASDDFAQAVSSLGVRNDDVLIFYGQHGMLMGPARAWWMFRGFGHKDSIVLNGGLPAWKKTGYLLDNGPLERVERSAYSATIFDPDKVVNMQDVLNISQSCACPIIDARPAQRYNAEAPEPREGMRSGHIPNALNIPASSLVDTQGLLKSRGDIEALLRSCGQAQKDARIVTTCGSGITACALALAFHYIGRTDVAVYDGSWSEWGREISGMPVAVPSA